MIRFLTAISAMALLAACGDGQSLIAPDPEDAVDEVIEDLPPGTETASAARAITRYEDRSALGGGLVKDVSYDAERDVFTVDNIGFDGANRYRRDADVPTLSGYRVYAARESIDDFLTGTAINQIVPYRAIYGVSRQKVGDDPRTSFAIVRTGGYFDYGFGGFVYERAGGVTLPDSGQARFSGKYGGMRVFSGQGGLQFVRGDMTLDIDFEDFDANDAVRGRIRNRRVFDDEGNRVGSLSDVFWIIEEGSATLDANGEILNQVYTLRQTDSGAFERDFEGTFNGLIAGDTRRGDGGEVVGVITMEAEVKEVEGLSIQETGGAILTRR